MIDPIDVTAPDCFWCSAVLFQVDDRLICPDCASVFDAHIYLTNHTTMKEVAT